MTRVLASPVLARNDVHVSGPAGAPTIVFAHGFGCDQTMWRHVTAAFEDAFEVVLFDHVGSGRSDTSAYDPARYASLHGYAGDALEILAALDLDDVTFVGHSVSAMIGVLAANAEPGRIGRLVLLGGSPCYIDDGDYTGGFTRTDIDDLLESLDLNIGEWSRSIAPMVMGNADRPELGAELEDSFLRGDTAITQHFGRVTFLSDHRADVAKVRVPTLILQSSDDVIVPREVAEYLHRQIPGSRLEFLETTGHYPHLAGPSETIEHIRGFL